jgi:hypothetical protein
VAQSYEMIWWRQRTTLLLMCRSLLDQSETLWFEKFNKIEPDIQGRVVTIDGKPAL